ncbi:MAG: DUF3047 domain-containing protein [Deltaproteobacteria bacterium]|nr:DUF3047 domain-containing protein [Deltaproteobacteria bacterium]
MAKPVARTVVAVVAVFWVLVRSTAGAEEEKKVVKLSPGPEWKIASMFSGKTNYYKVIEDGGKPVIRASYDPKLDTVIMYRKLKKPRVYSSMGWVWRVHKFPRDADETVEGRRDSAGAVYVYFKGTFREYVIKYVWSVALKKGAHFETADSNILKKMHLVVIEGPPPETGKWRTETVDLQADFRRYFLGGKADGEVPPVVGIGLLTDGDGTKSVVEADYAGFELRE